MWGGTKKNDPEGAIRAAIDHGINLIDTAPMYGYGHSEELVGDQTHWQDSTTKTEETMAELLKLKQKERFEPSVVRTPRSTR
jgi:aryl-alcohol dehydrogenase-like predicted oxidoreductase